MISSRVSTVSEDLFLDKPFLVLISSTIWTFVSVMADCSFEDLMDIGLYHSRKILLYVDCVKELNML